MEENKFQKALEIATKGGLGLLLYNTDNDQAVAVLPLQKYEQLIENNTSATGIKDEKAKNLTEIEMIDKINRDIALWKNEQESNVFISDSEVDEDPEYRLMLDDIHRYQRDSKWRIPVERTDGKKN